MVDIRRCRQDRAYNPLRRVPTLVLDDGDALIESQMILDYLDGRVAPDSRVPGRIRGAGASPGSPAFEPAWPTRRSACSTTCCTKILAALGRAMRAQIRVLAILEADRAAVAARSGSGKHRPCRYRRGLRAALCRRGASRAVRRALSRAQGAFRALRSAAGISGNRAAARAAEGVIFPSPIEVGFIRLRHI